MKLGAATLACFLAAVIAGGCGGSSHATGDAAAGDAAKSDAVLARGDAPASTDGAVPAAPVAPFDWVGVLGTGQSLSVGVTSTAMSTTQPFHNLKLVDTGPDPKYPIDGSPTAKRATTPPSLVVKAKLIVLS